MSDQRWGFEEAEDWEDERHPAPNRGALGNGVGNGLGDDLGDDLGDTVAGRDPDGAVTVVVGPDAEVLSVVLSADWRSVVDPRALHHSVRAAANNATMLALARQFEAEPARQAPSPATPSQSVPSPAAMSPRSADETPITREDALRLLDAVSADLDSFTRQLSAVADQRMTAESAGRHVRGSALRGQVVEVAVDANWASSARAPEIEAELLDVLRRLHRMSTPTELAGGPQGSAIAELNALLSDPQALLRRVGLLPASTHRGED